MSEVFQVDKVVTRAYLMINCHNGCESHVVDELRTFSAVKQVQITVGRHDILTLIETGTLDELRDVIAQKIRKIPEVYCTTTLVCTE
jgi:DNA-binding Lrp family transcriptional regulator